MIVMYVSHSETHSCWRDKQRQNFFTVNLFLQIHSSQSKPFLIQKKILIIIINKLKLNKCSELNAPADCKVRHHPPSEKCTAGRFSHYSTCVNWRQGSAGGNLFTLDGNNTYQCKWLHFFYLASPFSHALTGLLRVHQIHLRVWSDNWKSYKHHSHWMTQPVEAWPLCGDRRSGCGGWGCWWVWSEVVFQSAD